MSFFSQLKEFFESIFGGSSPEARQKQELRKIETELRNFQPAIYKARQLLPNFAEVFKILQENLIPLEKIFRQTIDSEDIKIREKYYNLLIQTGFSDKSKEILENSSYENRKRDFFSLENQKKISESQRKNFDVLLKELNSGSFSAIEQTLQNLEVLSDICKFSYTSLLREFDKSYNPNAIEQDSVFVATPIEVLEQYLQDFYFLTAHFKISASLGRAISALSFANAKGDVSEQSQNMILGHVRKIATILNKYFSPAMLKKLICVARSDAMYEPKASINQGNIIFNYSSQLKKQFENDTQRIEVEIKDEHIEKETANLFEGFTMQSLAGYSQENGNVFFRSGAGSFLWTTPLQILKSFVSIFIDEKVINLLNNLVVEGFFNNPQYKSDFSSIVFTCSECEARLQEFEKSFDRGNKNDIALMTGYLHDSHKDPNFMKSLAQMINAVNNEVKTLIQQEVSYLFQLHKKLADLLPDARKTSPEHIENSRVLFTSPRNKDSFEFLETTFPRWNIFLDIMRNYAIIGDI